MGFRFDPAPLDRDPNLTPPRAGERHSGAIFGFRNIAGNGGAATGAAAFAQLVHASGSYPGPLIPRWVAPSVGAVLWLTVEAPVEAGR